uniref:Uncharacterized protein n=1 Tax=Oryza meridionalis TaxID=40149 RepID=A0A0E0FDG8_9ORYZ
MGRKRRARVSRDGDGGGGGGGEEQQEEEEPTPAAAESKSLYEVAPGGANGGVSPDSLRNTPSNISRLEDAIEHCAARRKYLARTKSPSDGEDVRWYSCKLPLGRQRRVLRGHWFARKGGLDWIPLREDVSEQLELAYNCQLQLYAPASHAYASSLSSE